MAKNEDGVSTLTTSSALRRSMAKDWMGATGTAEHHPGGALGPRHLAGGPGRRPGGDAVVDDDHRPPPERHRCPPAAEPGDSALELGPLAGLYLGELVGGHAGHPEDPFVDDSGTAFADGAHRQLGLEGHAQLADHDHVEGRVEGSGHLEGHGYPAPGETDDHDVRAPLRRRAWLASFGTLHHALESIQDNDETWLVLKAVLPRDPEWDRCGRLRKGAVETVVRDRWSTNDIEGLLRAVPEYGPDFAQALRDREERKKRSRGWFLDFVDKFLP